MPLRPIDVIFTEPKERYLVVYQNGQLHKLARMKLDINSWRRREPYTGGENAIVVANSQSIDDPVLKDILNTQNLPATLYGRTLPFFKAWWETNGYQWLQDNPASMVSKTTSVPSANQTPSQTQSVATKVTKNNVANNEKIEPKTQEKPKAPASSNPKDNESSDKVADTAIPAQVVNKHKQGAAKVDDDFFDNLLDELNH